MPKCTLPDTKPANPNQVKYAFGGMLRSLRSAQATCNFFWTLETKNRDRRASLQGFFKRYPLAFKAVSGTLFAKLVCHSQGERPGARRKVCASPWRCKKERSTNPWRTRRLLVALLVQRAWFKAHGWTIREILKQASERSLVQIRDLREGNLPQISL